MEIVSIENIPPQISISNSLNQLGKIWVSIFYPIFLLIGFGEIFPKSPDGLVKLHVVKSYNFSTIG